MTLNSAHCGISILDLETGKPLHSYQDQQLFIPASLTKLFTSTAALHTLENYRFRTSLKLNGFLSNGIAFGDLILIGGADSTLDRSGLKSLVEQLYEKGVRKIEGDIFVDDSFFKCHPLVKHAEWEDLATNSASEINPLSFEDNTLNLHIKTPSAAYLEQEIPYCTFQNDLVFDEASTENEIKISRKFQDNHFIVSGKVYENSVEKLAIHRPQDYAKGVLIKYLKEIGIEISRTTNQNKSSIELGSIETSFPALLKKMNKESCNLTAELLIRTVGKVSDPQHTCALTSGLKKSKDILDSYSLNSQNYILHDGAGLSRQNLITPMQATSLLRSLYHSAHRDLFIDSLPIGGVDGSLKDRFIDFEGIFAKTGTLTNVANLAGYAFIPGKRKAVFCICINKHLLSVKEGRKQLDQLLIKLLKC